MIFFPESNDFQVCCRYKKNAALAIAPLCEVAFDAVGAVKLEVVRYQTSLISTAYGQTLDMKHTSSLLLDDVAVESPNRLKK